MGESRYLEIPGSGQLRITTRRDIRQAKKRQDLERSTGIQPLSFDEWMSWFSFQGKNYPFMPALSQGGKPQEEPEPTFEGYVQGAYKTNGVVFACMLVRFLLFSEARFQFRQLRSGRPGDLFGTEALAILERPWPNGTTGDLLARAIQDADLAGNFYAVRQANTLKRLRPDWVTIVLGSELEPNEAGFASDAEVIGYMYKPGGPRGTRKPVPLLPEQVCHFAPIPDPVARFRGMSWLTPVLRDIMGDKAATEHKLNYFENGATPNLAVISQETDPKKFAEWVSIFKDHHRSTIDAYQTMFLAGGADAKIVGSDLKQVEFKATQGAGETRIAAAAGVPPVIVGLSEGLQAATYSNYGQARRRFADGTMRPLWRNIAGSLSSIIDIPPAAELWYDDRDIPFLQEDVKDAAEVIKIQMSAIREGTDGGYEPSSVVDAVTSGDLKRLKHSGKTSVQLYPGGEPTNSNGKVEEPVVVE